MTTNERNTMTHQLISTTKSVGTSLQGYVEATRSFLELLLGEPTEYGEGDKVTTEWAVEFDNGVIATIYDWKRYEMGAPEMDEVIEWHIGGNGNEAVYQVCELLGLKPKWSPTILRWGN